MREVIASELLDGVAGGPAFPPEEFDQRLDKTRQALAARRMDAALFFGSDTRFYLCGYEFPANAAFQMLVVPISGEPFIVTRKHFELAVRKSTWIEDCITFTDSEDPIAVTQTTLNERKLAAGHLGMEQNALTLTVRTAMAIQKAFPSATWSDCSDIVDKLRMIKSAREIAYMRRAAAISDIGLEAARAMITRGVSERDIVIEISRQMTAAGGEYQAIPVLVGIGEQARLATPMWSNRRLGAGEIMWVEVFGTIRRYAAGLKGSFGAMPASAEAERRAETTQRAYRNAIAAIKPGEPATVVADAVQETFREAGYPAALYQQCGYSIGISFAPNPHEARLLGLRLGNMAPLEVGMTLFPIANLYGPGATVSTSGMVVVTEDGAEPLTKFVPKPSDLSL